MAGRLPPASWWLTAILAPFALVSIAQDPAALVVSFTAFEDTFPKGQVSVELENEVLVLSRSVGDGGSVRVHWGNSGGVDGWEAIAVISDSIRGFARSIDLHNGLLAIGIDANDGSFSGDTGSVRIYRIDPLAIQPVTLIDTLVSVTNEPPGPGPEERFGRTVHWFGDTLLVGAVGSTFDQSGGGTGRVYVFVRNGDQWSNCGSIQPDVDEFQLPFLGRFGEVIASSEGQLVIGAPFSGSTLAYSDFGSFTDVLGSLHFYHRDNADFETCGWSSSGIIQDVTLDTTGSAYLTLETGRQGIAFSGPDVIAHISGNYTLQEFVGGNTVPYGYDMDDEGYIRQALREGCDHCGLRSFRQDPPDDWAIRDTSILPMLDRHAMGLGGWAAQGDLLFVNRYDTLDEEWATDIHARDEGGMDHWGTLDNIPEQIGTDECARYNTPIAVSGPWLVRLPSWSDTACDQRHITRVEVFRLGDWVGAMENERAPERLIPYPNPTTGSCSVLLPVGKDWVLDVVDAVGRCARSLAFHGTRERVVVDLTGLSPGTYVLCAREQRGATKLFGTCAIQTP